MIALSDTKFGTKRKAIIGGVSFNVLRESMDIIFFVQLLNNNGDLLDDKSLNQNRKLNYLVSNDTKVDNQFNPVNTGGTGEYDFFLDKMKTIPLPDLVITLGNKLNERGLFD